jgi:hypothetical protein
MIVSSARARITGGVPEALAWAKEMSALVAKVTGGTNPQVALRVGGHQDVIWTMQFENLAAFEKGQQASMASEAYISAVKKARDGHLFDTPNVEFALWQAL